MKRILILWLLLLAWASVLLVSAGADDLSAPNPSAAEVESDQPRLVVRTGHSDTIGSVAFSPDGQILASREGGTVKLWDVETGKEVRTLSVEDAVESVAFAPDGRMLAVIIDDVTTTLWDVATGQKLGTPSEYREWVGTVLATIQDMSIRLWRIADGAHRDYIQVCCPGFSMAKLSPLFVASSH